jgi:hypothetical protein
MSLYRIKVPAMVKIPTRPATAKAPISREGAARGPAALLLEELLAEEPVPVVVPLLVEGVPLVWEPTPFRPGPVPAPLVRY